MASTTRQRQPIAWLRLEVPPVRAHGRVRPVHRKGARDAFRVVIHAAVVDEGADRQQLRQLGHAADVIAVKVRDEQVVDPRYAGEPCDLEDALRIARLGGVAGPGVERAGARETRVDEQRLPGGGDDEGGLPTLHVDEVDVERPCGGRLSGGHQRSDCERKREDDRARGHADVFHFTRASRHTGRALVLDQRVEGGRAARRAKSGASLRRVWPASSPSRAAEECAEGRTALEKVASVHDLVQVFYLKSPGQVNANMRTSTQIVRGTAAVRERGGGGCLVVDSLPSFV